MRLLFILIVKLHSNIIVYHKESNFTVHKLTSHRELLPLHICECGQSKYHGECNNAH